MNKVQEFLFNAESPLRLDRFLADSLEGFSRGQVQALIAEGKVAVNGLPRTKEALRLNDGDSIRVEIPQVAEQGLLEEKIPLDILYEDESVLVLNKPSGMVVHPGAGNAAGTLVNAALAHFPALKMVGEPERPGVVHRLDKETSGVIVLAKTDSAYTHLVRQFKSRRTEKTYLALVDGIPATPTGRIEANIQRDERYRQKMAVAYEGKGRRAVSEYRTLRSFSEHTLLEVKPLTGRTHQIRVHLAYLGVPVAGDRVYGRRKSSIPGGRFFLHAHQLKIELPDGTLKEFTAPLPAELELILKQLEGE
ncbi:MAG: RluA family pseudouridine synthase [Anaerolineaceae bacterium]|nr:RluA family pseudouridine synthase [Anaerolineaceae bacterium]